MPELGILPALFVFAVVITHIVKNPTLAAALLAVGILLYRFAAFMGEHVGIMANSNSLSISFSLFLVALMDALLVLFTTLPFLTWAYDCEEKPVLKAFVIMTGVTLLLAAEWGFFPPFERFLLTEWLKEENFM